MNELRITLASNFLPRIEFVVHISCKPLIDSERGEPMDGCSMELEVPNGGDDVVSWSAHAGKESELLQI